MKTIYVFYGNRPVLDIITETSVGVNFGVKYGKNRDRLPDRGWSQLRNTRMSLAKEVELTEELRTILIEDLAYAYGGDSTKFTEKLKEFGLLN